MDQDTGDDLDAVDGEPCNRRKKINYYWRQDTRTIHAILDFFEQEYASLLNSLEQAIGRRYKTTFDTNEDIDLSLLKNAFKGMDAGVTPEKVKNLPEQWAEEGDVDSDGFRKVISRKTSQTTSKEDVIKKEPLVPESNISKPTETKNTGISLPIAEMTDNWMDDDVIGSIESDEDEENQKSHNIADSQSPLALTQPSYANIASLEVSHAAMESELPSPGDIIAVKPATSKPLVINVEEKTVISEEGDVDSDGFRKVISRKTSQTTSKEDVIKKEPLVPESNISKPTETKNTGISLPIAEMTDNWMDDDVIGSIESDEDEEKGREKEITSLSHTTSMYNEYGITPTSHLVVQGEVDPVVSSLSHLLIESRTTEITPVSHSVTKNGEQSTSSVCHSVIEENDKSSVTSVSHSVMTNEEQSTGSVYHSVSEETDKSSVTSVSHSVIKNEEQNTSSVCHSVTEENDKICVSSVSHSVMKNEEKSTTSVCHSVTEENYEGDVTSVSHSVTKNEEQGTGSVCQKTIDENDKISVTSVSHSVTKKEEQGNTLVCHSVLEDNYEENVTSVSHSVTQAGDKGTSLMCSALRQEEQGITSISHVGTQSADLQLTSTSHSVKREEGDGYTSVCHSVTKPEEQGVAMVSHLLKESYSETPVIDSELTLDSHLVIHDEEEGISSVTHSVAHSEVQGRPASSHSVGQQSEAGITSVNHSIRQERLANISSVGHNIPLKETIAVAEKGSENKNIREEEATKKFETKSIGISLPILEMTDDWMDDGVLIGSIESDDEDKEPKIETGVTSVAHSTPLKEIIVVTPYEKNKPLITSVIIFPNMPALHIFKRMNLAHNYKYLQINIYRQSELYVSGLIWHQRFT
jgi:hypothetical protein